MTEWLSSLTPEELTAIFTGISTLIIIIGAIVAIINLRVIAKTQILDSVREFLEELKDTAEDRGFLFNKFNFSSQKPEEIPPETEKRIQNVVNSLNRIGFLLENRLLSSRLVFSICHPMIIKCCHKLKEYVRYRESRVGGRYGRRLDRLDIRAKTFHDANPQHRTSAIKFYPGPGKEPIIIYQTTIKKGLDGLKQKINWNIRRLFSVY